MKRLNLFLIVIFVLCIAEGCSGPGGETPAEDEAAKVVVNEESSVSDSATDTVVIGTISPGPEWASGTPQQGEAGIYFNVYELFPIEDDEEFEKRLTEIPEPFQWMDEDAIRMKRTEYLEQYHAIKGRFSACRAPGAAVSLPAVLGNMGDPGLAYQYGICRRFERGPEGCAVLKETFPEYYEKCIGYEGLFWFDIIPFVMKPGISDADLLEYGERFCGERRKETGDFLGGECAGGIAAMLKPLQVIVSGKGVSGCDVLSSGVGKEFCEAVFAGDAEFCGRKGKQVPLGCMNRNMFGALAAVAAADASLLPAGNGELSFHNVAANYFIRKAEGGKSYCDIIFDDEIIPVCGALEESEIAGIEVYYP